MVMFVVGTFSLLYEHNLLFQISLIFDCKPSLPFSTAILTITRYFSFPFFSVLGTRRQNPLPRHLGSIFHIRVFSLSKLLLSFLHSYRPDIHYRAGKSDILGRWRLPIQLQDHKVCASPSTLEFRVPTAVFAFLFDRSKTKLLADFRYR